MEVVIFLCLLFFWGEPDLYDALMNLDNVQVVEVDNCKEGK